MVQGHYPLPALEGERVAFTRSVDGFWPLRTGEGTFTLCWLGITEVWDVTLDDGSKVHLYPELGDAMERVE